MSGRLRSCLLVVVMAFDLFKLQILQEALHIVKTSGIYSGMCNYLLDALIEHCGSLGTYHFLIEVLPEVMDTIEQSVYIKQRTLESAAIVESDLFYALEEGFIWPTNDAGDTERVKYLERLIEDEISGTYNIDEGFCGL